MVLLREISGLPLRKLADQVAKAAGMHRVSHNTIEHWFKGGLPQQGSEQVFVRLLYELDVTGDDVVQRWLQAVRRLRSARRRRVGRATPFGVEPYRGLQSFGVEDSEWFFGRDEQVTAVLDRLAELDRASGGVLMIVGASGAGKSSLLRAGVMAALSRGRLPGSEHWTTILLPAAPRPLDHLVEVFADALGEDRAGVEARLRADPAVAGDYVRRLTQAQGAVPPRTRRMVLVVDQFEQVLAGHDDQSRSADNGSGTADPFVAALCAAATGPDAALVVVGLRADFYAAALAHPPLATAVQRPITLGPMDERQLEEVITQPATKAGVNVGPEFMAALLHDISSRSGRAAHSAGVLPLLSHALHMTWLQGRGNELTAENYRAIGGLDGAIKHSAEKVYTGLAPDQRELARRLFLSLVQIHPDSAETRRRVPRVELAEELTGGSGETRDDDVEELLDRFIAERLITVDADAVEITHDALIASWPTLREWLESDRTGLLLAQRLKTAARDWDRDGRERGLLYRGARLVAARTWASEHSGELPEVAVKFIDASNRHARRRTRRLYRTIVALVSLLVLTVASGVVAWQQRESALTERATAIRERDDALSRMLAIRAGELRTKDVTLSRQLALTAYRTAPTAEARSALLDASAMRPAVRMLAGDDTGIMSGVSFHPSGEVVAAAAETTVRLWDTAEPARPRLGGQLAGDAKIYATSFAPDGSLLAAACADGTVRLWDTRVLAEPVPLLPLTGLGGKVYSVVFSQDGRSLATAAAADSTGSQGSVQLWQVKEDGSVRATGAPIRIEGSAAKSVSFHASGRFLAIGTQGGAVEIRDITDPANPSVVSRPAGPTKAIGQLAFSPDGHLLAAGSADFAAYVWNVEDPRAPVASTPPITGATSWINAVTFSPDSTALAVASSDADLGVRVFDAATMRVTATMPHPAPATAVKFSPDGKSIATGANDGVARLWPLGAPVLGGMTYLVSAVAFSPDGNALAVGSAETRLWDTADPMRTTPLSAPLGNQDAFNGTLAFAPDGHVLAAGQGKSGTVRLLDVTDPSDPVPLGPLLPAHEQQVEALRFSPDGDVLATGGQDGAAHLWDVRDPMRPVRLATLTGFQNTVSWLSFSPNGRFLATASFDKTVRLWDVTDPARPALLGEPFTPTNHYTYSAEFSPDGRTLAVSSADSTVRLYDLDDPARPEVLGAPLTGPTNYVHALSFNADGTTLAAAVTNGTVWLWDMRDRHRPVHQATLTLPTDAVYTLDFHPRTDVLAAGSASNTAWLWHTDPERAAELVCATTGDPITEDEWAKHVPGKPYQSPCATE
ncbi:hypothetical protein ADK67_16720 [Saccharothrix sp. NRRL B-16348]|nr:hypothetical protein ADK67_16720 [Saccharothrix sp. NRRL B-16348]